MTMLMLEDAVANSMHPHGVCSGEATVTVYRKVALHDATAASIYHEMMDFGQLAARAAGETWHRSAGSDAP